MITKARHYLKTRQSKLQHLTTFGLMLASAETKYRELRLATRGNRVEAGTLDSALIEAGLDFAVLKYLKKRGNLPSNITKVFRGDTTLEDKFELSQAWMVG